MLFPRWVNTLPIIFLLLGGGGALASIAFVGYYFSPEYTDVGYMPSQPVPYSHKLHAGELGIDCRYCHTAVEKSPYSNVPASQTCMNCHSAIKTNSPRLLPVRESYANGTPIPWVKIHKEPDYAHFNHAAHVGAGVGCVTCHGRIDQEIVVRQVEPLSMGWCLECHRAPQRHLRPRDQVTNIAYERKDPEEGVRLMREYRVQPPENCSQCHY